LGVNVGVNSLALMLREKVFALGFKPRVFFGAAAASPPSVVGVVEAAVPAAAAAGLSAETVFCNFEPTASLNCFISETFKLPEEPAEPRCCAALNASNSRRVASSTCGIPGFKFNAASFCASPTRGDANCFGVPYGDPAFAPETVPPVM
jgi:hypothetical protein